MTSDRIVRSIENGKMSNKPSTRVAALSEAKTKTKTKTKAVDDAPRASTSAAAGGSALARLPPELWVHVLRQAFDVSESWAYDTSSRMRCMTAAWAQDETFLANDGQRGRELWSWRLVSRAWNALLLPLLFDSFLVYGSARDLERAVRALQGCVGASETGRFVRYLTFRFDEPDEGAEGGWPVEDVASQIYQVIKLCPGIEEILWIAADDLPAVIIPALQATSVRKLHLRDWRDNPPGEALLDFAAAVPSLEVLGLVEACLDMDRAIYVQPRGGRSMPNLQHIALRLANANVPFIRALGSFDLPRLTSVVGDAYQSADIDALQPLLQRHGKSLKKLVLLYPHAHKTYGLELSLLALCPFLEEYITHLPLCREQRALPSLPRLRRIGLFGFVPAAGSFSEPLTQTDRQAWWDEKQPCHKAFLTSLSRASLPALSAITLFDLFPLEVQNWAEYVYGLVDAVAHGYVMQGITLENADGQPVLALLDACLSQSRRMAAA
ncbi:hypothetical protein CALCODRAFT_287444 [Calocera cornea HHB12733]|uniref:Uncharacterized protein n=1 Tax=Calocera cornea HHB12733 TaxID=1353952 RepID=A0A165FXY4_9BASI|nr:hypothetical protein CALCODRAFT_287444 [Calocera cornea HHB12733]